MIKQCLSIDQMRHLKELGVDTSKASMLWIKPQEGVYFVSYPKLSDGEWLLSINIEDDRVKALCETVPAFTLQDILDKLPHYLNPFPSKQILFAWMIERDTIAYRNVEDVNDCLKHFTNDLLIDAAYDMLCWCIENGYIGKEK